MEFEFELIYLFELIDVEATPVHYNNLINILSSVTSSVKDYGCLTVLGVGLRVHHAHPAQISSNPAQRNII